MAIDLTNRQARRVILQLQGLAGRPNSALDDETLYELICQLGFVQVDSIQWVERAHHMILFSRNQNYRPQHLHQLIERDGLLFENYTHDASVIPSEFFRYWRHKFERSRDRIRDGMVKWQGEGFLSHCDTLLEIIESDGSVRSRDLEKPQSEGAKEMWQWHDGKAALEYLWRTGELAITARDSFQKVYDLSHRTIPKKHFQARSSGEEFIDWACRSALQRLGFGTPSDIAAYWKLVTISECREWLNAQPAGEVANVTVASADGAPRAMFARPDIESLVESLEDPPPRLRVLSPFDPVIRDRKRLEWLFDFHYRIEIYVPAAKRKYGYYIFPLLEGDKLVGRADIRADRKSDCLRVSNVWVEPKVKWSDARSRRFDQEMKRVAKFAGVSQVERSEKVIQE